MTRISRTVVYLAVIRQEGLVLVGDNFVALSYSQARSQTVIPCRTLEGKIACHHAGSWPLGPRIFYSTWDYNTPDLSNQEQGFLLIGNSTYLIVTDRFLFFPLEHLAQISVHQFLIVEAYDQQNLPIVTNLPNLSTIFSPLVSLPVNFGSSCCKELASKSLPRSLKFFLLKIGGEVFLMELTIS